MRVVLVPDCGLFVAHSLRDTNCRVAETAWKMSSTLKTKRSKSDTKCQEGMLPPKPKKRFDPQSVLEGVREKLSLTKKLQAVCEDLTKIANEVVQSTASTSILQQLNKTNKYLVLMGFLGYEGLKSLEFASQLVPKSFGTAPVCNIVNHHCHHDESPITEEVMEKLLPVIIDQDKKIDQSKSIDQNKHHMFDSLMQLSEKSGGVYTMFITPPVKECINPSCNQFGQLNSLSANHAPTDVVVFDIDGPILASKLCLKCKSCSTIYNYNKFGRKFKEGERYYEIEQDLIEITDVVYITKRLYSLYRSLWSVKLM